MPQILKEKNTKYYKGPVDPFDLSNLKVWSSALELSPLDTSAQLEEFIQRFNELELILKDSLAEIYTAMTCNTADKSLEKKHAAFFENVISYFAPVSFTLKNRVLSSPALASWAEESPETRGLLLRWMKKDVDLFREENIPLSVEESALAVQYRSISGGMTVNFRGEEKTLPELGVYLKDPDRSLREEAWRARSEKMASHQNELADIFDKLLALRQNVAANAGFKNYRDFAHSQKGRFSYSVNDVLNFQGAVEEEIVPLIKELNAQKQKALKVDTLRPWDISASADGRILRPVPQPDQLADMGIKILNATDAWSGDNFASMKESGLLDLLNRKNKAPGGYSYPFAKYGASFIFMNAVGIHSDLTTLVHEAGHAMHEFGSAALPYTGLMELPMEAAELASMSMEMLTMPHWDLAYKPEDHKKSMRDQLEEAIRFFPWCVTVDGFQQRIYTENLDASARNTAFVDFSRRFSGAAGVDWNGLDDLRKIMWLFQLHVFEVPFYYIEYGIAQLGALAVYRKYKQNPAQALADYKKFLNTGPSRPLEALYKTAGIELKFTRPYIKEITSFVREELEKIK